MDNTITKEFHFKSLLLFALPTMIMMVFLSTYSVIDGIFIARYVGTDAVAAVNIVMPIFSFILGFGIMFGTGGSAIIAKKIGEGKSEEAKANFTFIAIVAVAIGMLILGIGIAFIEPILRTLGATDLLYQDCYDYGKILLLFAPITIFKSLCDSLLVTAGKPKLGLVAGILGGVTNIILDYLFIVKANMGIKGAGYATILGQVITVMIGLWFFSRKKHSIHFVKPQIDWKIILKAMTNGSSEMITQLSGGITTLIFNLVMLDLAGEKGVAAISIALYIDFLMVAIFLGFSGGVAPIISYNYGNKNQEQLKRIIRYCVTFVLTISVVIFAVSILCSDQLANLFAEGDKATFDIASHGLKLFCITFLFAGINIFTSSMFTALSNGKISALVSFLKSLVFVIIAILLLPKWLGIDGVWLTIPVAEILTIAIAIYCLLHYRKVYGY